MRKRKDQDEELPPLYDVEVLPVERRRRPGRRATDPKPARNKARKKR